MKDQLSALMDSELSDAEALRLVKAMKSDPALQEAWDAYHLVGDALRKSPQLGTDFSAKLSQRLAQEPTVLAPQRERAAAAPRRFPFAIAASVAAVSLVGILTLQITRINQTDLPAQVATAPVVQPAAPLQVAAAAPAHKTAQQAKAPANTPARVAFSRATSSNYLLAHQEFAPSYAPAYVRVVAEQVDNNQ